MKLGASLFHEMLAIVLLLQERFRDGNHFLIFSSRTVPASEAQLEDTFTFAFYPVWSQQSECSLVP